MNPRRIRLLMWKEVLQLLRDKMMLPLIFVMPVMQLVMFGYVVGADVTNLRTVIVDQDHTATSRAITEAFSSSGYFRIVDRLDSEGAIRPVMDAGDAAVAVLLPPGMERDLAGGEKVALEIVVDGSDSKTASVASGYAAQVVASFERERLTALGAMPDGPGIDARVRVLFNPALRSVNAMIPGLVTMVLMLSVSSIMSQAVVRERERGTLEQLFVTPIGRAEYVIGKVVPYVGIAIIQTLSVMMVGVFWFRVPFYGSVWVMTLGLLLFMLAGIGQGLIISMISHTRHQAQQTTMFILIPTMVLSGFIFPIESMPASIVPLTYLIPMRYILVIARSNAMKGAGFEALWPQFVAMAAFAVVMFGFGVSRFRKQLAD
ncbi:MAG: ABC transporter permease [Coriobacteriia bacterium]|nr:ABC transporter permease [Coriobacteriia bacterium]